MEMDIRGGTPRKVIVTERSIKNGRQADNDRAKKYLEVGKEYTVVRQEVHSWYTQIVLEEFLFHPEIKFNSVQFEEIEQKEVMTPEQYTKKAMRTEVYDLGAIVGRLSQLKTIRLLHASEGMQTESAEFTDAIKKHLFCGKELDVANLKEELGDTLWYIAIACDELGTSFEQLMDTNIKKLEARYPEKFTEDKALNRNLVKEREILEDNIREGKGCL